jgi:rubrerythrin
MGIRKNWWRLLLGSGDEGWSSVVEILCRRYMREKQHAMRYRQHGQRMHYPQFRDTLVRLAAEEEKHASMIAKKIKALGAALPDVIPIHVPQETNSWHYLRTDLEEEQRCAGELHEVLPGLSREFPDVVELIERIEDDGKKHRAQLREMLARSDPQSLGPG